MTDEAAADHTWIVEVLSDLDEYAAKNKLNRLRVMVAEAREIAREEIMLRNPPSNFCAVMDVIYPNVDRKSL